MNFSASKCLGLAISLLLCACATLSRADIQFDPFPGYDSIVPEASWFPIVFEVKNDGPTFTGTIEITESGGNQGQARRATVELPTGTLKRLTIPVFSTSRNYGGSWDARLFDERGKLRKEFTGLRMRKFLAQEAPLIGALPRTAGGMPLVRAIPEQASELQPATARFQPSVFPDNPLVLEGLSCLYLSSEKASELKERQVNALIAWLNAGGHLIVAVDQVGDINAASWLKSLFPMELTDMRKVTAHRELQEWLRNSPWSTNVVASARQISPFQGPQYGGQNVRRSQQTPRPGVTSITPFGDLPDDPGFEVADLQVAVGNVKDGQVVVSAGDAPLIVASGRGRGRVTALLFSPEREPFRSWKNLSVLWAKLADVPGGWYVQPAATHQAGWSTDGMFACMIETRQVHKLPVEWLLLLLIVYLVVIGPLDQFWLKRIGRPMLTWITFPCYVVLFSLLIYFIGYKLRAGESEWNELHIVDVLSHGDRAELRGRTFASIYSPSNQRYNLESAQKYATLRGEFIGGWQGQQSSEKANVWQNGDSFRAEIFVPVWTSQTFISDWWQSAPMPLEVSVAAQGENWLVKIDNKSEKAVTNAQIVIGDYIMPLGVVPPNQAKSFTVARGDGLKDFIFRHAQSFQNAVQSRRRAFGESGRIEDLANSTIAASFISQMSQQENSMFNFVSPPGIDVSPVVAHGNAVVFACMDDYSPTKPINQFTSKRSHRQTVWRVAVPVR